ncbi:MAG: MerR family transcriptional regulator [Gammaproteobacteria bacterium]|nr:MerR family transcriptional regulator [Gammaproteobacteria bacterium]
MKLTIGTVAQLAGVNLETIRYYQRRGLITEPEKPEKGFRIYPQNTITRIRFIKRAQKLGFTLKEINQMLDLGQSECGQIKKIASTKISELENKIKEYTTMRDTLVDFVEKCDPNISDDKCGFLNSMSNSISAS